MARKFRNLVAGIDRELRVTSAVRAEAQKAGHQEVVAVANLTQHVDLMTVDFSIVAAEFFSCEERWHKYLYGRIASLMIVECFEDFGELLGKKLRDPLVAMSVDPVVMANLNRIHKELNSLRDRNEEVLRRIRNNVFGHREFDTGVQLSIMENLDPAMIGRVMKELMTWLLTLQEFTGGLLPHMSQHVKARLARSQ
jgi:hypothetical protein